MLLKKACAATKIQVEYVAGLRLVPKMAAMRPTMGTCTTDLTSSTSRAPISKYWTRKLLAVKRNPEKIASAIPICSDHLCNKVELMQLEELSTLVGRSRVVSVASSLSVLRAISLRFSATKLVEFCRLP